MIHTGPGLTTHGPGKGDKLCGFMRKNTYIHVVQYIILPATKSGKVKADAKIEYFRNRNSYTVSPTAAHRIGFEVTDSLPSIQCYY